MNKKKWLFLFIILFTLLNLIGIYFNYKFKTNEFFINKYIYSSFFQHREDKYNINKNNIIILNIDNKSIKEIGQWPWNRKKISNILDKLINYKPALIGIDILFSEKDRSSPSNFSNNKNVENYDKTLSKTIENSDIPIVLGYTFSNEYNKKSKNRTPYIPAIINNKDNIPIISANGINLNIPLIQESSYSNGFLSFRREKDNTIISTPLLIKYKDNVYPALSLEIVRIILGERNIDIIRKNNRNYINLKNKNIPLDKNNNFIVNYFNISQNIKTISILDFLNGKIAKNEIQNKIILISSKATGLGVLTNNPLNYLNSSSEIHATIIENILFNNYLKHIDNEFLMTNIISVFFSFLLFLSIFWGNVVFNSFIFILLFSFSILLSFYLFITSGLLINLVFIIFNLISSFILSIIFYFIRNKDDMKEIKSAFASKVSKEVMDDILTTHSKNARKERVSIFFSDIVSFTKISQTIKDSEDLSNYINRYMETMSNIIVKEKGTIDKFIGDAIMAYWNPELLNFDNHQDLALTAAINQIYALNELNKINRQNNQPNIQIRIGLHYGEVWIGEIGSKTRNDYTIIGQNVNTTAFLEQAGKYYKARIIISEDFKRMLKQEYVIIKIDCIKIKGTNSSLNIYEVFKKREKTKIEEEIINSREKAIELYKNQEFEQSLILFKSIKNIDILNNNHICNLYIKRCKNEIIKSNNFNYSFEYALSMNKLLINE